MQLDAAYMTRLKETAEKLANAAKSASARPAGQKVTQGDLDRADGINIHLLTLIIRAFENGHEQDPTIPRLVPIATRRLFSRAAKKKAEGAEEKPEAEGEGKPA
jgi:hypothetical protein